MQEVSTKWNENQKKRVITAPTVLELDISVTDPEAQADANTAANGETEFSYADRLADGLAKHKDCYATLEPGLWVLDGTRDLLPAGGPYNDNGYIGSALCGNDGTFSKAPSITVSFSKVYETYLEGVTITWGEAYSGELADTFTITAYNGSTAVATKTVTGNADMVSVVFMEITGYDSIVLTVEKWAHPQRRARIRSLLLGIRHTYNRSAVSEYSHKMSVDLLSAELPDVEVSFQVTNLDFLYDPDNDSGLSKYLMSRQQVEIRYGYELDGATETIPAAVVFLDEWESPRDGIHASFTARSLLIFMESKYTGTSGGTLHDIATAALTQAGLPKQSSGAVRWVLDRGLSGVSVPSGLDLSGYTIQEVLQFCANAGCCALWQDRSGVLHMEPIGAAETEGYAITTGNEFGYPETSLTKPLGSVNINDGAYVLTVAAGGVEQPVQNPLISADRAPTVAAWVRDILLNRQTLAGEWRADPKTDVLDTVTVDTPFKTNRTVLTSVELTFNGAFRGTYEGRVMP